MRKFLILLPLLALPVSALAQQTPLVEVFGGYSNLASNINVSSIDLNGVNFSAQENLNSWFGGVLDFSTHFGTENGLKTNTQTVIIWSGVQLPQEQNLRSFRPCDGRRGARRHELP